MRSLRLGNVNIIGGIEVKKTWQKSVKRQKGLRTFSRNNRLLVVPQFQCRDRGDRDGEVCLRWVCLRCCGHATLWQ